MIQKVIFRKTKIPFCCFAAKWDFCLYCLYFKYPRRLIPAIKHFIFDIEIERLDSHCFPANCLHGSIEELKTLIILTTKKLALHKSHRYMHILTAAPAQMNTALIDRLGFILFFVWVDTANHYTICN